MSELSLPYFGDIYDCAAEASGDSMSILCFPGFSWPLLVLVVITQLVVYQANKIATSAELWCNGSMPDRGSGDSRFEHSEL